MTGTGPAETKAAFERAEERVEERGKVLRKELGLGRLVLTQILYVVGLTWVRARVGWKWALQDSNLGPTDYESAALTT